MRARSTCLRGRFRSPAIAANGSRSPVLNTTHTCCARALGIPGDTNPQGRFRSDRHSAQRVAQSIGVSRPTVWRWQQRFAVMGVEGLLRDKTHKPGRAPITAETMTHDYKRHNTTTLFAAFSVLDGTVIGRCRQRHRNLDSFASSTLSSAKSRLASRSTSFCHP
jgi:hypothetical protein